MTLHDALVIIDRAGSQMAIVVDAQRHLLGTLSDGDARRGLLKGLKLTDKVSEAMHLNPTVARVEDGRQSIIATMRSRGLHQLPLVDKHGVVVGLEVVDDFLSTPTRDNWVVLMAGGLGSRLKQLTHETPKPMLKVGSRPLLETILRSYIEQGFRRFYFAVNYKGEQIEAHFGDGSAFNVEIHYLREEKRLGTAGALGLLPERPTEPILVANADILTKEDFGYMVDQHQATGADATMAVREYEMQVPFGVIRERDGLIETIEEKPVHCFTVSAGIYVLSPHLLDLVPADAFFDMPSLFEAAADIGLKARCHHIDGYWLDIGRLPDYERANLEFHQVFQ
ncbi:nucleotidyltransferase family protein [Comamonadaceae bacterium G21597-S1]|nr:nucleotidyltransferase family protein [Comamonadaceae bacterium G21597-S1]